MHRRVVSSSVLFQVLGLSLCLSSPVLHAEGNQPSQPSVAQQRSAAAGSDSAVVTTSYTDPETGLTRVETTGALGSGHHPSRLLVRFRPGAAGPQAFLPGSGPARPFPGNPDLLLIENPPGLSVAAAVSRYKSNPNVLYAEPDYVVTTSTEPTDPLWSQQWDMRKISAPAAWSLGTYATDVIVAVIDTGINFTHPDLQANLWSNADGTHGFTCINGTCSPGGSDDQGHGTHVAGTIGALADNGIGIAGINWHARIMACKFLDSNGSGNLSDAVLCFQKIRELKQQGHNIRVASNSWGGGGFSQTLKDAMAAVEEAGILNVCAAGNNGQNADLSPMYPAGYENRGILSVLATDSNDLGASFTNYGVASVDLAAPGVSTLSTVPTGACALCDPSGYKLLSGTSMATPHVSAVAAALFHLHPELSAYQARDALLDSASYDPVADQKGAMTSSGGRLNFEKVITNPFLSAPKLNNFPAITGVQDAVASTGETISLSASASDPDNDPLRMVWARGPFNSAPGASSLWLLGSMLGRIFPSTSGGSVSLTAPALSRPAVAAYSASVSDGKGGSDTAASYAAILPSGSPGRAPSGTLSVSPSSGPAGTTVTVNFPVSDPEGGLVAWDLWQTGYGGGFGWCCQTGSSFNLPINQAGAYRLSVQAVDGELNFSERQSAVVRIGGATGTPPIARASFSGLTGPAPLTVDIDLASSSDPDGTVRDYIIECRHGVSGTFLSGSSGTCVYDTPGNYWILLTVKDNEGLADVLSAYAVVTPSAATGGKAPATVILSNLTQTYTGSSLAPTATTNPPGLAITWTNAPQTSPGSYAVTATVSDPNYQGSASGTFTIRKPAAAVTLGNLTQIYNGSALTPTATTNPPGLAIVWTNAPQTKAGAYTVTATVNDPNYQGSATGTFTISKLAATVTLGNLTQIYTGKALTPTVVTNPAGLAVTWTNAPQTNAGAYSVTATINDSNYQGSTTGTFTVTKAAATVTLGSLTQTYTGSPLTPTAVTSPAGLPITWTNAPKTSAGSYTVTATVNSPNYQGSATGTFTISPSGPVTPPSVVITSPLGGAVPSGPLTILATVTAGSKPVARVDFLVNGTVKCSDTAAPYSCVWNMPTALRKSYELVAKAYDTAGAVGTSQKVTVTR